MKSYKIFGAAALAAAMAVAGAPARAQVATSATVVVKQNRPKPVWLKAEVVHADAHSIIVRERANALAVHTFTYSPKIQDAMQKLTDQNDYQYGDKVKILYQPGDTVALKIAGKPSKPL
ncbi:MAG: hypothetical protein ABR953_06420 [Candidatus Acidiferrales bacterium]|jgi:hypothetical protein